MLALERIDNVKPVLSNTANNTTVTDAQTGVALLPILTAPTTLTANQVSARGRQAVSIANNDATGSLYCVLYNLSDGALPTIAAAANAGITILPGGDRQFRVGHGVSVAVKASTASLAYTFQELL